MDATVQLKDPFPWLKPRLQIAIVGLFALLLYGRTIPYDYNLDDEFLYENEFVQEGFSGIPDIWTHGYHYGYNQANDLAYRPHVLTMAAIEIALVGNNPTVHHFGNVLLFALAGMVLLLLLQQWFHKYPPWIALGSALIWVSLPVHTEVVCSIKNREEILAFLWLMLALLFFHHYLKREKPWLLALALFTYFGSLTAKEHSITFLAIFPLAAWVFTEENLKRIAIRSAWMLLPAALYLGLRSLALDDLLIGREITVLTNSLAATDGFWDRLPTVLAITSKYISLTVTPRSLSYDYSFNQFPVRTFGNARTWIALISLGLMAWAAWRGLKNREPGLVAVAIFIFPLFLVNNFFFLMGVVLAERFLFIPSLGFALGLGILLHLVLRKELIPRKIVPFAILPLLIFYTYLGFNRQPVWQNKLALFESGVETAPNSAKAHFALASEYIRLADNTDKDGQARAYYQRAADEASTATVIYGEYPEAWYQLGLARFRLGKGMPAELAFQKAVELRPDFLEALNYLGVIQLAKGSIPAAQQYFIAAIEADPEGTYARPLINMGATELQQGNLRRGIDWLELSLEIDPNNRDALSNLSKAWQELGNPQKSAEYRQRLNALRP